MRLLFLASPDSMGPTNISILITLLTRLNLPGAVHLLHLDKGGLFAVYFCWVKANCLTSRLALASVRLK